jgi:hypothetical protein
MWQQRLDLGHKANLLLLSERNKRNVADDKKWKVPWDEEELVDFGDKIFVVKCTACDYYKRIKNPTQFFNYTALHQQQSGHTGMVFSEEGKI